MAGEQVVDVNLGGDATEEEIKELNGGTLPEGDDEGADDKGAATGADDDGDEDDENEGRTAKSQAEQDAGTDEEKATAREHERNRRLNQRQRKNQRIETLERQLSNAVSANQDLHNRISSIENVNLHTQFAQLEGEVNRANQAELQLKDILADAATKNDGVRVAEATAALLEVGRRKEQLEAAKGQMQQQSRQPARPQSVDTEAAAHATEFLKKVPWYKGTKAQDTDSMVMSAIDKGMTNEGWDPRSPSYWNELESRVRKHIGHRFQTGQDDGGAPNAQESAQNATQQRRASKSPVAGSSQNTGGDATNPRAYRLSAGRVDAMKQAGIWNDPARREKMIARYKEEDRINARNK